MLYLLVHKPGSERRSLGPNYLDDPKLGTPGRSTRQEGFGICSLSKFEGSRSVFRSLFTTLLQQLGQRTFSSERIPYGSQSTIQMFRRPYTLTLKTESFKDTRRRTIVLFFYRQHFPSSSTFTTLKSPRL